MSKLEELGGALTGSAAGHVLKHLPEKTVHQLALKKLLELAANKTGERAGHKLHKHLFGEAKEAAMPFESEAQRKWMYANEPEMAKRWQKHTPKGKKLPEHVDKKAFWTGFCVKCAQHKVSPFQLIKQARFTYHNDEELLQQSLLMGGLGALLGGGITATGKWLGPVKPVVTLKRVGNRVVALKEEPTTWGDVATNALLSGALSGGGTFALNKIKNASLTKEAFIPLPSIGHAQQLSQDLNILKDLVDTMPRKDKEQIDKALSARRWHLLKGVATTGLLGAGLGGYLGHTYPPGQGNETMGTGLGAAMGGLLGAIPGGLISMLTYNPKRHADLTPRGLKLYSQFSDLENELQSRRGPAIGGAIV